MLEAGDTLIALDQPPALEVTSLVRISAEHIEHVGKAYPTKPVRSFGPADGYRVCTPLALVHRKRGGT